MTWSTRTFRIAILCAPLALAACSDSDGPAPPPGPAGSVVVGDADAKLTVRDGPLAGLELTVPVGAVPDSTTIEVYADTSTEIAGKTAIGPAARFAPEGLAFASPVMLILPFDPDTASTGATEVKVQLRNDASQTITELSPTTVGTGAVTVSLNHFSTYWVTVAPIEPQRIATRDYLEPVVGNTYTYDNGDLATIDTVVHPNLPSSTLAWVTRSGSIDSGWYLSTNSDGSTDYLGEFDLDPQDSEQILTGVPVRWLPATVASGEMVESEVGVRRFAPFGSAGEPLAGTVSFKAVITHVSEAEAVVKVGFGDVMRVEMEIRSTSGGTVRAEDLWFAHRVGLVGFEGDGRFVRLAQARVNGRFVRPAF